MLPEPLDTDHILKNAGDAESARLTLRWALERIRYLENAHHEVLDLLKQVQQSRDQAAQELKASQQSLDQRAQALAKKERFADELETMLKDVFNGLVDVKELVKQRQELDQLKAQAETQALTREAQAQENRKKEIEDYAARLADMEAVHAKALTDAQNRYQQQLKDIERQRQEEAVLHSAEESRFREDLAGQLQKQADQYHQKLILLQVEYAARRKDLQQEYDQLKDKLFEENRNFESRQGFALRVAQSRWDKERKELQTDLQRREETIRELKTKLDALERSCPDKDLRRIEEDAAQCRQAALAFQEMKRSISERDAPARPEGS